MSGPETTERELLIMKLKLFAVAAALAVIAAACSSGDSTTATDSPTATEAASASTSDGTTGSGSARTIEAPEATIVVDGDASDWSSIVGLDLTLEPIPGEETDMKPATLKIAHDADNVYVLFEVDDDFDWSAEDAHLSAGMAVQWAIDSSAAAAMGAEEPDRETSLGTVDIWHWELDCGIGEESGGAISGPGDGKDPGNDDACNFDDEWSTTPENREDDNGAGAENSLLGVFSHSDPVVGSDGTYVFEMSRPLQTGDEQDAQFTVGETARVGAAYWDPDNSPDGWSDDEHVQTANEGWIDVTFL